MNGGNWNAEKRYKKINWLVSVGLIIAALILYIFTLAPTVLTADGGEFQFVPWLPGIAHPTGYPLYVLLGWAWSHLVPLGNVAWRMNLFSAVVAAATVGLTYAVARRLLDITLPDTPPAVRIITAAVSAATFAVTATFWSQAIIAEVYALHTFFVAAIVWLCLKFRETCHSNNENDTRTRGREDAGKISASSPHRFSVSSRWGWLLAFTFGLGLTHHVTTILLLPAMAVYLWLTRPNIRPSVKTLALYAIFAIAPLLLYLYLPLVAPYTPYAKITLSDTQTLTLYENSVQGFVQHITATVFTGELQPAAVGLERLVLVGQLARQQMGWAGILLALVGLATLWCKKRFDILALTGLSFLALVAFNLIYFIGDVFVLFIPPWWFVCLWAGVGILAAENWAAQRFVQSKSNATQEYSFGQLKTRLDSNIYNIVVIGLALFFFALPVALLVTRYAQIDQSGNSADAKRWQEILMEPIPEAAILISNDRNEIMPMWYYQYVEGHRPDLQGLFPFIVPQPAYANVGRVLDEALASNRPVYFIKPMNGLNIKADILPEGSLFKASAPGISPTVPTNITLPEATVSTPAGSVSETIELIGYDVLPGEKMMVTLYWQPLQKLSTDYTSYVHLTTTEGEGIAQNDQRPGGDFYPSSLWQSDEILRDSHTLTLPDDIAPGQYNLRVGMYFQPESGTFVSMGNGTNIGVVTVD